MPERATKKFLLLSILAFVAVIDVAIGFCLLVAGASRKGGLRDVLVVGGAAMCCGGVMYLTIYMFILLFDLKRELHH